MQTPTTPLKSQTTSGMSPVLPSSLTAGHSIPEPARREYYSRVTSLRARPTRVLQSPAVINPTTAALCCWFRWQSASLEHRGWWQFDEPTNLFTLASLAAPSLVLPSTLTMPIICGFAQRPALPTARPRFLRQNLEADVKGPNFDADVQDYVVGLPLPKTI